MIVDTSALVAAAMNEPQSDRLRHAMLGGGVVPAPVLLEYSRVVTRRGANPAPAAEAFLRDLLAQELVVESFTAEDAALATAANFEHGAGNGRGGTMNFGDLLVYAIARRLNMPILCTGKDFASTGIAIHAASRLY